jgi:hypothetical protein
MALKTRKNSDEEREHAQDEPAELRQDSSVDPVDVLMHELGAAGGTARVIVRKIAPLSEQGYVGEWSPADFSLSALAELGGPGKYAAQVRDSGGRYLRQVTLDVSTRVRRVGGASAGGGVGAWTPSPAAPAPSPPATPTPSLAETLLVAMMQQQGEMLRALATRPAQQDAGLSLLGSIVPAMMRDRSGPETLLRAVEVVDRLRGDSEPDAPVSPQAVEMRVLERIVERVASMLERRTPPNDRVAAPALENAPAAPTTPPSPPSTPAAPSDGAKPAQLPALVVLIAAAADDGRIRPGIVAQAVLDSIGAETARRYLDMPDGALAGEVVNLLPRLDAKREYLVAVERAVRELVRVPESEGPADA